MPKPMPNSPGTLTLADLSRLADVTPRTVRYYVAQGLLPSPGQSGPGARYPGSTLPRLQLIRELQRSHLPLAEIRTRLAGLTDAEVAAMAAPASAPPSDTAIDYIRGLLGASRPARPLPPGAAAPATAPPSPRIAQPQPPPMVAEEVSPYRPDTLERSQWDRIALTADIELQIRRPLGRLEQRRVERLITIARQVLKEDTP
jgi:DNA-binding transcriptional MerR regulator